MMRTQALKVGVCAILMVLLANCHKKPKTVTVPPPPPVEQQAPKVEEKPAPPPVEEKVEIKLETIHFDFDKYDIRPGDREILIKNGDVLKANPTVRILIEGHCDERG
ncbi:MAG: hypothetical protein ACPL6C_04610, partial [bacterium]